MKNESQKSNLRVVTSENYHLNPKRYELRKGDSDGAPPCPFGNNFEWIGFDSQTEEYVRFTKSVFKKLVNMKT